jgi:hypothetical protein
MEIKLTHVTFTQSKLLKEKGFIQTERPSYLLVPFEETNNLKINPNDLKIGDLIGHYIPKKTINAPEQWMVVEWLRVKHSINVEANYLSNISKYRWLSKPMNIIPKSFKTTKEYRNAVDKYYGKENFNTPQEAYSAAFDYVLKELI